MSRSRLFLALAPGLLGACLSSPLLSAPPSTPEAPAFRTNGAHSADHASTAAGRSCGAASPAPGLSRRTLLSGAVEREYMIYWPPGLRRDGRVPVVLDLHGSGSHPEQELSISGMASAADRHGFAVALPIAVKPFEAGGHTWNVPPDPAYPDDVKFMADLLDELFTSACADPGRVFLTGFSGGARLASEAACALSDRIAAIAAVGGLRAPRQCGRPVPVMAFHGTADPVNPYPGGGPAYWKYGIEEAFAAWAEHNGCPDKPRRTRAKPDVQTVSLMHCQSGSEVILYRVVGAGHAWPGSELVLPRERFGATSNTVDATALIVEFFTRHGLQDSFAQSSTVPATERHRATVLERHASVDKGEQDG